jgi:ankyrin repeat protein
MGQALVAFQQDHGAPDCHAFESYARAMLGKAAAGQTRLDSSLRASATAAVELPETCSEQPWTEDLELNVQHLKIIVLLHTHGADVNTQMEPHQATPLSFAAGRGNAAVVDMLCRLGADTELLWWVAPASRPEHGLVYAEPCFLCAMLL